VAVSLPQVFGRPQGLSAPHKAVGPADLARRERWRSRRSPRL